MSSMHTFDTLAFAKKLKNAGYTETQAEALAEAQGEVFREMLESTLATKEDIRQSDIRLETEIGKVQTEIGKVRQELELMGQRLTIRLGGMLVVAVGVLAAMRFFG